MGLRVPGLKETLGLKGLDPRELNTKVRDQRGLGQSHSGLELKELRASPSRAVVGHSQMKRAELVGLGRWSRSQ